MISEETLKIALSRERNALRRDLTGNYDYVKGLYQGLYLAETLVIRCAREFKRSNPHYPDRIKWEITAYLYTGIKSALHYFQSGDKKAALTRLEKAITFYEKKKVELSGSKGICQ